MNDEQIETIFAAQVQNVRELVRAWKHLNRDVNAACLKSQSTSLRIETKLLALVYCALAEAMFSKLIHTPKALSADAILQIKQELAIAGVREGWKKCVEIVLMAVAAKNSSHAPNVRKTLGHLIDEYIHDPSMLRNKIAHGQWVIALNRENTAVNEEISMEIAELDVVELYRRKHALEMICSIIEDLIKSPNRAHQRDYWVHTVELGEKQKQMKQWSLETKVEQLREKRSHTPE